VSGAAVLSARNPRVAELRRLARQRRARAGARRYVIEGGVLVADAIAAGVAIDAVFAEEGADGDVLAAATAAGIPVHRLEAGVLARVLTTSTPPPLVAVARWRDVSLADAPDTDFWVVLAGVNDPGNAGTILRSAEAAGAGAVLLVTGAVDPYNPKSVRASAGSIFRLPVVSGGEPVGALEGIGGRGCRRIAAVPRGGKPYDTLDLTGPVALVFGNEAHGLPPGAGGVIDDWAAIPMAGGVESLNVAAAATVLCFEVARQRREALRST
jgi:TrmH family RNA methyltransferase